MALKLEMFSDFICPFCYIGFEVVRKLKPEFDFALEWKGFQIHPEWPAEGMPAAQWRGGIDPASRKVIWKRIVAMGEAAGVAMKPPETLTNSRLALEAAEFAQTTDRAEAFEERIYRAYFSEGLNIGRAGVIAELAADAGLDAAAMSEALEARRYADVLKHNAVAAHERGVSGVPTFFVGEFPMVGAQSEDVMRQMLRRASERFGAAK